MRSPHLVESLRKGKENGSFWIFKSFSFIQFPLISFSVNRTASVDKMTVVFVVSALEIIFRNPF